MGVCDTNTCHWCEAWRVPMGVCELIHVTGVRYGGFQRVFVTLIHGSGVRHGGIQRVFVTLIHIAGVRHGGFQWVFVTLIHGSNVCTQSNCSKEF